MSSCQKVLLGAPTKRCGERRKTLTPPTAGTPRAAHALGPAVHPHSGRSGRQATPTAPASGATPLAASSAARQQRPHAPRPLHDYFFFFFFSLFLLYGRARRPCNPRCRCGALAARHASAHAQATRTSRTLKKGDLPRWPVAWRPPSGRHHARASSRQSKREGLIDDARPLTRLRPPRGTSRQPGRPHNRRNTPPPHPTPPRTKPYRAASPPRRSNTARRGAETLPTPSPS